ncbi:AT-hook motif nuclear-localized protein 11-like isoform X1 [Typha latifolia]|uniref:AT-hook motif nuclear-localized protein 11-like isoform X1 n=1 Tax=Typha latifolia TaxID=4733 RepID=UPI003C2F8610
MSSPASYFVQRAIAPGGAGSSPSLRGPSPVIRSMPNPGTSLAVHCSGGGTGTGPVGSEFHFEAPNLPFASAHGIRGDVPPAAVGPGEMVKKKRGRPRKYAPDGSAALALPPISSSAPPGMASGSGSASGQKRGRGRPPGTGRKQQLALFGEWVAGSAGTGFTPHVIRIAEGEDIASKLMSFAQQGPRAICIISANGAVSTVTLRQPAMPSGIATYEGRFEILCLSGSYLLSEDGGSHSRTGGLSISLSNHDGRVFGGGVGGLLIAATTVQVIVGSFLYGGTKTKNKDKSSQEPESKSEFSGGENTTTPGITFSNQNPSPSVAMREWSDLRQMEIRPSHIDIDLTR